MRAKAKQNLERSAQLDENQLLRRELLPKLNLFCFGQVRSSYGGGRFKNDIEDAFPGEPKVVTSEIRDKDEIYDAIKRFLGKGL